MRKSYSSQFKTRVALEAIRGERSIAQIASHFEVHPNQVRQWKKKLLAEAPDIFSDRRKKKKADDAVERASLYEQIGRLKMELEWLKKKSRRFDD